MKNITRTLLSGVVLATLVGSVAQAAPPAPVDSATAPTGSVAAVAISPTRPFEVITLPGTGDSQDLLRALAQSYMAQHPERQVLVPNSIGSDGGIRVVGTEESPIGRVARQPNAEEKAKYGEFHYLEFARVPVVFVVTPQAGVHNLSELQLCEIFTGRLTNWKDVGGNDLPIHVQWRPEGSNLQTIRRHIPCFTNLEVTPKAHFNFRNADLIASMRTVPGAIGFMPLSEAVLHGYSAVSVDGVAPNASQYKLGIGLGFVYKQPFSPSIQAFIDYLKTQPAQDMMRQTGHLPTPG
jgi:phosphate transport system substrate-binding protein